MIFKLSFFLTLVFALSSLNAVTGLHGRDVAQLDRRSGRSVGIRYTNFDNTVRSCGVSLGINPKIEKRTVIAVNSKEFHTPHGDDDPNRTINEQLPANCFKHVTIYPEGGGWECAIIGDECHDCSDNVIMVPYSSFHGHKPSSGKMSFEKNCKDPK